MPERNNPLIFIQNQTCCFTGHRFIDSEALPTVKRALDFEVKRLYEGGVRNYITGGALGFDTLAAEAVIKFKLEHPDVHLIIALPCTDHDAKWTEAQRRRSEVIKHHADLVHILSPRYYDGCMQARNRYMVDNSSQCISYCKRNYGGTYSTVCYAKRKGLRISELSDVVFPF